MGDRNPEELRALVSRFDTGDGLAVIGPDRRIVVWNQAAEHITGRAASETEGKVCCDIFGGRDPNGNRVCFPSCHVLAAAQHGETPSHLDLLVEGAEGQAIWLDMSTVILRSDGNSLRGVMHIFRDVTERRLMEGHLKRTLGEKWQRSQVGAARIAALTAREREVLRLFASGLSTQAIGRSLSISRATVRNHSQNILGKLGVHSMRAAIAATFRFLPPTAAPGEEGEVPVSSEEEPSDN